MKIVIGTLEETLTALAEYIGMPPSFMLDFATEDTLTGWDYGKGDWPVGSLHRAEGQTLYALAATLSTQQIVECGSLYGCSSVHIASALHINGGHLTSVDVLAGTGSMFPAELDIYRTQLYMRGEDYLNSLPDNSVDIVYEDTDHSPESVYNIWKAAIAKVRSGGLVVSHDAMHETSKKDVNAAIQYALGHDDYLCLLVPPADCGLAVWRKS
jgi:predicted O-methyltransferase YrrM